METPSNKKLREFIGGRFDTKELKQFCFDYFMEVENEFTGSMNHSGMVMELIKYCRRRELMENLVVSLQQERGELYQQAFAPEKPLQETTRRRLVYKPKSRNPKKVFVSHSSKDADLAQQIANDLQKEGYEIFITPSSIQPGEKWVPAIGRGMDESGIFLVLLTVNAVKSSWVNDEVNMAIALAHENLISVFLLDVEDCRPPIVWRQRQALSFRGQEYTQNIANLLRAFGGKPPLRKEAVELRPDPEPEKPVDNEQQRLEARVKPLYAQLLQMQADGNWLRVLMLSSQIEILLPGYRDAVELKAIALQQLQKPITKPVVTPTMPPLKPEPDRFTHVKTGLTFMRVPAGDFLYGENKEKRQLSEFWMCKTPVTNTAYKRFLDANPNHGVPIDRLNRNANKLYNWDKNKRTFPAYQADYPAVFVSWNDAVAFCKWADLGLPTVDQWEKAARGAKGLTYPWGNNEPTDKLCNFNGNAGRTSPIGYYSPQGDSPYGCADMSGNVSEWCLNDSRTPEDIKIESWGDKSRALRGGSWGGSADSVRATFHGSMTPVFSYAFLSFRVVAHNSPSH